MISCIIEFNNDLCDAESAMIANPSLKAYRYDPYSKEFTQEFYAHDLMKQNRKQAIQTAKVSAVNTVTDICIYGGCSENSEILVIKGTLVCFEQGGYRILALQI
jgi:hypothetical protein